MKFRQVLPLCLLGLWSGLFLLKLYLPLVLLSVWSFCSVKQVGAFERLVVFRLGRFSDIAGPGLVMLLFPFEKGVKVMLDKQVPDWRTLKKDELIGRVKEIALQASKVPGTEGQA